MQVPGPDSRRRLARLALRPCPRRGPAAWSRPIAHWSGQGGLDEPQEGRARRPRASRSRSRIRCCESWTGCAPTAATATAASSCGSAPRRAGEPPRGHSAPGPRASDRWPTVCCPSRACGTASWCRPPASEWC